MEDEEAAVQSPYDMLEMIFPTIGREHIAKELEANYYDLLRTLYKLLQSDDYAEDVQPGHMINEQFPNNQNNNNNYDNNNNYNNNNNNNNNELVVGQSTELDTQIFQKKFIPIPVACRFFMEGACVNENCRFIHDDSVKPKVTTVCKYFLNGQCFVKGCPFKHSRETVLCKYWLRGTCCKRDCIFSHQIDQTVHTYTMTQADKNATIGNTYNGTAESTAKQLSSNFEKNFPTLGGGGGSGTSNKNTKKSFNNQNNNNNQNTNQNNNNSQQESLTQITTENTNNNNNNNNNQNQNQQRKTIQQTDQFPTLSMGGHQRKNRNNYNNNNNNNYNHSTSVDSIDMNYKIKIGQLENMFKNIQLDTIIKELECNENDFEKTKDSLKSRYGVSSPQNISTKSTSSVADDDRNYYGDAPLSNIKVQENVAFGKSFVWSDTGEYVSSLYILHRDEAIKHARERNRLFSLAAMAFNNGDHSTARQLSHQGHDHNRLMRELHEKAKQEIFKQRNVGHGNDMIDLHGLHVREAIEILENYLGVSSPLYIIVGTGHHTNQARLPNKVKEFITNQGYKYQDCSTDGREGMIMVYR
ncbi:small MutS related family protein [Cavenderia fasciculata]|uniref:Small MutS related family protein n=1 Tax=Cavenderia fasciculata TaxID=261658 RepID=F4PM09_CACFS|nr:small MutS related family protein [Cavenderia fasciculata]EGG22712.1 small MutS related family protein [Cavenderia fasciculata]|eukprot:XP_004360563.1 small MutS related family protein [Cavenderia fasciculata]